jgi:hypothetical protein
MSKRVKQQLQQHDDSSMEPLLSIADLMKLLNVSRPMIYYYNETLPTQSLQLSKKSLAMRAIGAIVVTLLIGDQSQRRRHIQHGLGQGDPQEQAYLGDAERQGRMRVQARDLTWRGQGARGRWAQNPPLSG